jgi:hypothetical protein
MDKELTAQLVLNGWRVSDVTSLKEQAVGDGRTLVFGLAKLDVTMAVLVDDAAVAAVHKRSTYGFAHLRALLDMLPDCARCKLDGTVVRKALRGAFGEVPVLCDEHAQHAHLAMGEYKDIPAAPAIRHIEKYVRDYEERGHEGLPEVER